MIPLPDPPKAFVGHGASEKMGPHDVIIEVQSEKPKVWLANKEFS